jgi:ABC-type cobalamin/Fe3+-siderophores transport system ATPase subunit
MTEQAKQAEQIPLPETISVVSWSPRAADRRFALAKRKQDSARYELLKLSAVDVSASDFLQKLLREFPAEACTFVGLNLPIGLPAGYAKAAGIRSFREALTLFGKATGWENFYTPTDKPEIRQPFYPSTLGTTFKKGVAMRAFGLAGETELFRRCERRTARRYQAKCVFDLTFATENGRSAQTGWHELLGELSRSARLWPFDGALRDLIAQPRLTAAEVYPDESLAQLGLHFVPEGQRNKRNTTDRSSAAPALLEMAQGAGLSVSEQFRSGALSGFDSHCDFEVLVSLVALARVLQGQAPSDGPDTPECREVEGWILGQSHEVYTPVEAPRAYVEPRTKRSARRAPYFVHRIVWGPRNDRKTLEFAYPRSPGTGAINVICGLNNSGKSFLLEQLHRVMKRKPHRGVLRVEPRTTRQPRILFFGRAWEDKEKVGLVNLEQTAESLSVGGEHGDYLRGGLSLLASQMAPYLAGVSVEQAPRRIVEPEVREQILNAFKTRTQIYKCNGDDPLIQRLESILDAHLYFRCGKEDKKSGAWNFEFVLYYSDGTTLPFEDWSDGQRAIFYVLVCLKYFQPEIVLFDEIENHLHPAFISHLLEALRATPAQTIVATHHPHLIFSRYADRVFFLETRRPQLLTTSPAHAPFSSEFHEFERRVLTLEDNFDKITSVYRLFAHQDDQLLRQAGYIEHQATLALAKALSSIFRYPPVSESSSSLPDAQTQQLADRIRTFARLSDPVEVTVLDLGSGVGRQVAELAKFSEWQLRATIRWTCFEPIEANGTRLLQRFPATGAVKVVGKSSDLGVARHDFCVIANVLHELTPTEFVRYLNLADLHTRYETGGLVILELFPLLHAEAHAVPYESAVLRRILRDLGYDAESIQVPVRQGTVSAYCLLARRVSSAPETKQMIGVLEKAWKEILVDCLSSYALKLTPSDLEGYRRLVSRLTTIASIASWNEGKWKPTWAQE